MSAAVAGRGKSDAFQSNGVLLLRLGVFAFLVLTAARTWADPDLWGHVRFGHDILVNGLRPNDPYSFTSDIGWVNHEWLAEVLMSWAWTSAGNVGLVGLKLAVILSVVGLVMASLKADAVPQPARDLLVCLVLVGMWARVYVVRPQLFSLLLFAVLLWALRWAERGLRRRLWVVPPVFAVWVNVHGGWIVGMAALAAWAVFRLSAAGRIHGLKGRHVLGVTGLSIGATLANPYGFHMWEFLAGTVRPERPNIGDWRPLFESGREVVVPWTISVGLCAMAAIRRRVPLDLAHAAVVAALAALSIRVNRVDIFFTLAVVMLLARQVAGTNGSMVPSDTRTSSVRVLLITAVAAITIVALASRRSPMRCIRLDGPWMPERESGAFISRSQLHGKLLVWFDWGEYAIWHFGPGLRVSIDGRRETVYSDDFVARHVRLYFAPDAEREFLGRLEADYAWLPAGLPLVATLERAGWTRLFSGDVSVVLASHGVRPAGTPSAALADGCFPGP